jgi:hypothetical protein
VKNADAESRKTEAPRSNRDEPWWRKGATLVGVVGLLITLLFNTLGVRDGAKQTKESRETQQIGLLTQLDNSATNAEETINSTSATEACDGGSDQGELKVADDAKLLASVRYYEYLAWLFNHKRLTVDKSRDYFGVRMINGWRLALRWHGRAELKDESPELTRFVDETKPGKMPPDRNDDAYCPEG